MKRWCLAIFFILMLAPQSVHAVKFESQQDSDGDGFSDEMELFYGYDPYSADPVQLPKIIKVSLKDQTLSYYTGPHLIKSFKVSTGLPKFPTPRGTFKIEKKVPVIHYIGEDYNYPNTKWNLRFKFTKKGSYYVHGAYWHNRFGRPYSHGCVNVAYANMERLYEWADVGTPVVVN